MRRHIHQQVAAAIGFLPEACRQDAPTAGQEYQYQRPPHASRLCHTGPSTVPRPRHPQFGSTQSDRSAAPIMPLGQALRSRLPAVPMRPAFTGGVPASPGASGG